MFEFYDRRFHDRLAVVMHGGTLLLYFSLGGTCFGRAGTMSSSFLIAMEVAAVMFHVYYAVMYHVGSGMQGKVNRAKWIEYGISATLGTVGVLTSPGSSGVSNAVIAFVAIAGCAQQFAGWQIDLPTGAAHASVLWPTFWSAALLQVGEFTLIVLTGAPTALSIVYVVMWSLFGVHAGIRLWVLSLGSPDTDRGRWGDTDWTESVYSCLSWVAKLSVFWSTAIAECHPESLDAACAVGLPVALVLLIAPVLVRRGGHAGLPATRGTRLIQ